MGTNYYISKTCECCGHTEEYHIGKSSKGWAFALHVIPEMGLDDLENWVVMFAMEDMTIKDEYGREISMADMVNIISNRSHLPPTNADKELAKRAGFVFGVGNLLFPPIDDYCIGYGYGTWSLHPGEFC